MTICASSDCDRTDISARGLCSACYQRLRYQGRLDEAAPPIQRPCAICGNPTSGLRWGALYCSKKCNSLAYHRRTRPQERAHEACDQCGVSLAGRRLDVRFCSAKCGNDWRNARISTRTLEAKRNRPPCRGCGGVVAAERYGKALYCSKACRIRSRRHETYGLTKVELEALLEQHGVCAVCGTDRWGKKGPQVDHCHDSGEVRGVLCVNCNTMLGHAGDDPVRLRAAAKYLED